jgi:L-ribulose-5-phosphate 3-epimerase
MNVSTSLNVLFSQDYVVGRSIERCRTAGFRRLDFNYWDYQPWVLNKTWGEEEAWGQSIRADADLAGIRFSQMHGPVHGSTFACMVLDLNVDSFLELAQRSLRTAAILGVPWVVFHPTNIGASRYEKHSDTLDFNCQFFRRLFPVMEETGVGIALENLVDNANRPRGINHRSFGAVPEELAELVDTLAHPLVGACWDTGHGHRQGLPQGDSLRILGNRLKATHIQDNDGVKDHHLLPYHGTIDWNEVITTLREIGYAGDFTYETHNAIRVLPDKFRDEGLRYAAELGNYLLGETR